MSFDIVLIMFVVLYLLPILGCISFIIFCYFIDKKHTAYNNNKKIIVTDILYSLIPILNLILFITISSRIVYNLFQKLSRKFN